MNVNEQGIERKADRETSVNQKETSVNQQGTQRKADRETSVNQKGNECEPAGNPA